MEFTVGQRIVHPKYGLGVIRRIESANLLGEKAQCLNIHFPQNNTKILVPLDRASDLNMRKPMSQSEVHDVYKTLKRRARALSKLRPRDRVKIYRPVIDRGQPADLAAVVRDLGRFSQAKRLTDEETTMMDGALDTLAKEMALAEGREPQAVRQDIEAIIDR